MDFDTTTKPEGTLNTKVNKKLKYIENEKKKRQFSNKAKSLNTLEKNAEEFLSQEVIVIMTSEF